MSERGETGMHLGIATDHRGFGPDFVIPLARAVAAGTVERGQGIRSRVVSMPSWEIFENQTQEYRDSVLPPSVKARVAVEQASTFGWERYVGTSGQVIGMKTFGASAPLKELQRKFGFEPDRVVGAAKVQLGRA